MTDRDQPPRRVDKPEPGYFKIRLVKHGPWVGARIYNRLFISDIFAVFINGVEHPNPHTSVWNVWHHGVFITKEEYERLINPPVLDPYTPHKPSFKGMANEIREAEERDFWMFREIG